MISNAASGTYVLENNIYTILNMLSSLHEERPKTIAHQVA